MERWQKDGRRLVELMRASRPDLVELARLVSPAVRVEAGLLRHVRLSLTAPPLPVAAEADLWFSPLVSSDSTDALVLDRGAADALRERLAAEHAALVAEHERSGGRQPRDPTPLERSATAVRRWHVDASPAIRLEEQIIHEALLGAGEEQLNGLLGRALATLSDPDQARPIARWATRALPALPEPARASEAAAELARRARGRLQEPLLVGAALFARGIALSEPPAAGTYEIAVPAGTPITLRAGDWQVQATIERGAVTRYEVQPAVSVPPAIDVITADGRVRRIEPAPTGSTQLDLRDLQGDIVRAYGNDYDHTSYAFVRIEGSPAMAQAWLASVLDHVTNAEPWTDGKPLTTLNVAMTATGLRALGVSDEAIASFSHEFRSGMSERARRLGDVGASGPKNWDRGLGSGQAHVLLTINAQEREDHERALGRMRAAMEAAGGLAIIFQQDTELLEGAREHFGFTDGFSQPAIEGVSDDRSPGGGVPLPGGGWRALAPGEFVLGYPDEDTRDDPLRRLPNAPVGPLGRSGTYMVWRKLHQDVALWRRVLHDAARYYHPDGDTERLAAKVVGRRRDGTPLVTEPDRSDMPSDMPSVSTAPGLNDFRYADDPDGRRCPLGAHIRRANPRDALGFDGALSFRHRMIRRGMPYGEELPEGVMKDDRADRGLVFVSFQASISRQFEAVQMQWLNDGNIFGLGHDKDFVLGDPHGKGKMTIEGDPPFFLAPQEAFVKTRGGEYLFVPGMSALAALADGTAG